MPNLTDRPDGRDIKIKVKAKKKDEYGYNENYLFGLTADGWLLYRTNYVKKYRIKGSIADSSKWTLEWLTQYLVKHGFEIIEENVKKKANEPDLNYFEMNALLRKAQEAGLTAGNARNPVPMIVQEHENPLDDNSPVVVQYAPVMGGVCGFAWIHFPRANSKFVNFLKKKGIGHTAYGGGYDLWVGEFGQSMEKKEAYARAFAQVMRDAGFEDVYSNSRLD